MALLRVGRTITVKGNQPMQLMKRGAWSNLVFFVEFGFLDVITDCMQPDGSVVEKRRTLGKGAVLGEEVPESVVALAVTSQ